MLSAKCKFDTYLDFGLKRRSDITFLSHSVFFSVSFPFVNAHFISDFVQASHHQS